MLKLDHKQEAQRIKLQEASGDEPEAFIVMAPITSAMRRRAIHAARRMLDKAGVTSTAELDGDQLGDMGETISRELIRLGAVEWGGVGDADGKPLELTPDRETRFATANADDRPSGTIDLLLTDEQAFNAIDEGYVRPDAIRRAEKNGLSALPNGIGEAGTPGNATASSAAKPKRKAAAKRARTAKTNSAAKPRNAPGKSSRAAKGK